MACGVCAVCLTHTTQISAQVSASAEHLFDERSAVSSITRSRIVEDALCMVVSLTHTLSPPDEG
jgi:hypothetical protein